MCDIIFINTLTERVGIHKDFQRETVANASESGFKSEYTEVHLRVVLPKVL